MNPVSGRDGSPGRIVVISGPSGSGKTSICRKLLEDPRVRMSVSATTRPIRPGEVEGEDYFFLTGEDFRKGVEEGKFLEHATYNGNLYGTLRSEVERPLSKGHVVLLEIEVEGTRRLQESGIECDYIFIMPPSFEELERRLCNRHTEDQGTIRTRLEIARGEMDMAHLYDHLVINKDLDEAILKVKTLLGLESPGENHD